MKKTQYAISPIDNILGHEVIKLCLHVTSAFASTSSCIKRQEWIPWYQVEVFTLWMCVQTMGWEPILCMCVCVTIDSIQNFDAKVDADAHANVTCKQNLRLLPGARVRILNATRVLVQLTQFIGFVFIQYYRILLKLTKNFLHNLRF